METKTTRSPHGQGGSPSRRTVKSEERSTSMGATHYTAVLVDDAWVRVSDLSDRRYLGRFNGYEHYAVDVSEDTVTADFHRSNSGKMEVTASNGKIWHSFEEAKRWAKSQN